MVRLFAGAELEGQGMRVEGMWPYWLDGHAPNTVKNSFDMSSMYLLTGRDMSRIVACHHNTQYISMFSIQ